MPALHFLCLLGMGEFFRLYVFLWFCKAGQVCSFLFVFPRVVLNAQMCVLSLSPTNWASFLHMITSYLQRPPSLPSGVCIRSKLWQRGGVMPAKWWVCLWATWCDSQGGIPTGSGVGSLMKSVKAVSRICVPWSLPNPACCFPRPSLPLSEAACFSILGAVR